MRKLRESKVNTASRVWLLSPFQLYFVASLVAQVVKNPPATPMTWVQSLGWEDPLEKGTTTHPHQ